MNTRLGKPNDAAVIAMIHEVSSARQPGGFMYQLGRPFLVEYYRTLLHDSSSIVLCAVDNDDIIGFVAGALDAGARVRALKRNRFRLLLASLPALLRHPQLIRAIYSRQQSADPDEGDDGYVIKSGAHEEFWGWLPTNTSGAIELHLKWLSIMRVLGVHAVRGEVDRVNNIVLRTHQMLGARVVKEFVTPDGRQRLIIEYKLDR